VVQHRKQALIEETHTLLNAIRTLNSKVEDPLSDPATLAQAVSVGLMDAPQLVNNAYAPGHIRTRSIDGAIYAVNEMGEATHETIRQSDVRAD
jgi:hypothetical protein